ncbi:MAG: hypothetical protein AUJ85_01210 [Elusimicrobia bacterium CG1_02_37_114]|nr:MAG: hypothetical protein AUJ85_01210 [Elusimicrobia bacterium CG1_02_37_114]PIV52653.1 MAG: hypothetical protein COS17_07915 [Elusimicrobia bacterium CG02_land_8_20_14_3_00_37_13]PIZ13679.1 MAG: hypothetical protein COY53_03435 [Elusimicrobia bacterium CG_4_10_14_0_8_um_filter_37_32]
MAKEKKEKEEQPVPVVEKMPLDAGVSRNKLVALAVRWAHELYQNEEYRNIPYSQVLDSALKDILAGKIEIEKIEHLPPVITRKSLTERFRDERRR